MSVFPHGGNTAAPFSPPFVRLAPSEADVELEREAQLADELAATLAGDAGDFDPSGLYALEVERDLAASLLVETIPADVTVSLMRYETVERHPGIGVVRNSQWSAVALLSADTSITKRADSPTAAVNDLLAAYKGHVNTKADEPTPETNITESASGIRASVRIDGGTWIWVGKFTSREKAEQAARSQLQSLLKADAAERAAKTTGYVGRIKPELAADAIEAAAQQVGDTSWLVIDSDGVVSIAAPFRGERYEDTYLNTARYAIDVVNGRVKFAEPVTA